MSEERPVENEQMRKQELTVRRDQLRQHLGLLWEKADGRVRRVEDGLTRVRGIHPVAVGAAGIAVFLLRRKLFSRKLLGGPALTIGMMALEEVLKRRQKRVPTNRLLPEGKTSERNDKRLPET